MKSFFKNNNYKEEDRGIEAKIEKLKIPLERVEELENMKCKDFPDIDCSKKEMVVVEEEINLDKLVGWNRLDNGKNWLENLGNLHKFINFTMYNEKEEFENFMNKQSYDLPEVIEYQNEYYINGNGKHRLTIAKCVGVTKVKALVIKSGL